MAVRGRQRLDQGAKAGPKRKAGLMNEVGQMEEGWSKGESCYVVKGAAGRQSPVDSVYRHFHSLSSLSNPSVAKKDFKTNAPAFSSRKSGGLC